MAYANPKCGIYAFWRDGTSECYVGQSVNCELRHCRHLKALKTGKHHSRYFQRSFDKHGEMAFRFEILEECDRLALTATEQKWMDALNPCFNAAPAAGSILGVRFSPEARAACAQRQKVRCADPEYRAHLSRARRGQPSPWKGKTHSAETRALISERRRGKRTLPVGFRHSEESKRRMSLAQKGRTSPNRGKTSKYRGVQRSPEVRARISAGLKAAGLRMKPEHKERLRLLSLGTSRPWKGVPRSIETRARISAGLKGKPWSEKRRQAAMAAKAEEFI